MNRKRRLSHYFSVDYRSFQGKVTLGFFTTAGLAVLLMAYPLWTYKSTVADYQQVVNYHQPLKEAAIQSESLLQKTNQLLMAALAENVGGFYASEREVVWKEEFAVLYDSMVSIATRSKQAESLSYVYSFGIKARTLRDMQNEIMRNQVDTLSKEAQNSSTRRLFSKLQTQTQETRSALNALIKNQDDTVATIYNQIDNRFYQMPFFTWLLFFVTLFVAIMISTSIIVKIFRKVKLIKDKIREIEDGEIPDKMYPSEDEFNSVIRGINTLADNLTELKNFATEVGGGNLKSSLKAFRSDSEMGAALLQMRDSLRKIGDEDKERNWFAEGINQLSILVRRPNQHLNDLCDDFLTHLIKYLSLNQGGIYVYNQDPDAPALDLISFYAYNRKKYLASQVAIGEGLIGEAFREKKGRYLTEIPADYIRITSGIGESMPRILIITPLINNLECVGILELASFSNMTTTQREFVEKAAEILASTTLSLQNADRTENLLRHSQKSSEMLRQQEEEMRQNMEELQATQEGMQRKEAELEKLLTEAEEQKAMFSENASVMEQVVSDLDKENETFRKEIERLKAHKSR